MATNEIRYKLIAGNGKKYLLKVLAPNVENQAYQIYYRKSSAYLSGWHYLDSCIDLVFMQSTVSKHFGFLSKLKML